MEFAAAKGWRPTGRDFQNICSFLFKRLDPNWQCEHKFEDEVAPAPLVLREALCGYTPI